MRRRDLINRVRTPVAGGHHRVAVLSLKGGVGKTTTAVGLGATLATLRGDRVIAVDANPDRGTLSDKVRAGDGRDDQGPAERAATRSAATPTCARSPRRRRARAVGCSPPDRDPGVSVAFGADDYCDVSQVLEHFYSICITDCGTGLLHSAMSGVPAAGPTRSSWSARRRVDGARSASATLDWLEAHNCADLVRNGGGGALGDPPEDARARSTSTGSSTTSPRAAGRWPGSPTTRTWRMGRRSSSSCSPATPPRPTWPSPRPCGDGLAWPRRLTSRSG